MSTNPMWETFNSFSTALIPALYPLTNPNTKKEAPSSLDEKWGITNSYQKLKATDSKSQRIVRQHLRYAGMILGRDFGLESRGKNEKWGSTFANDDGIQTLDRSIDSKLKAPLKRMLHRLENMGYKQATISRLPTFYNSKTGIIFRLAYDSENQELSISFLGMGNEKLLRDKDHRPIKGIKSKIGKKQLNHVIRESFGGVPPSAIEAIKIGKILKTCAEEVKAAPVVTGHSHGGGLAQCAAIASGIKAVVFNSRPVGAGMRKYIARAIGKKTFVMRTKEITSFSCKRDPLSGNRIFKAVAGAFEQTTGIIVPRTLGKGYLLPIIKGQGIIQHNNFEKLMKSVIEDNL